MSNVRKMQERFAKRIERNLFPGDVTCVIKESQYVGDVKQLVTVYDGVCFIQIKNKSPFKNTAVNSKAPVPEAQIKLPLTTNVNGVSVLVPEIERGSIIEVSGNVPVEMTRYAWVVRENVVSSQFQTTKSMLCEASTVIKRD